MYYEYNFIFSQVNFMDSVIYQLVFSSVEESELV